jgi:His-Xaa-Ser system radical SAM maturase HxsC
MLALSGFATRTNVDSRAPKAVLRLSTSSAVGDSARQPNAYLFRGGPVSPDYEWMVTFERYAADVEAISTNGKLIVLPNQFEYLANGDIIRFVPGRNAAVRVLFRTAANANYFLTTERCNHYCLMCSQPPKDVDDGWLADEICEVVPLLPPGTPFFGITGGEPTLIGEPFFRILSIARDHLPDTPIHILSNGRSFCDMAFARRYAELGHRTLSVGIPLYAADPEVHDYVVQSKGAFDETVAGVMNLKSLGQQVEIRVVVHKQTYKGLTDLAEFIFRNLTFVDHITFMGLEITGFTRANMESLWIDPHDYRSELRNAVRYLAAAKMNVSVYNHQLCVLDESIHRFAKRSISDWKNEYVTECNGCRRKEQCGGFFASSKFARSAHISPFLS